MKAISAIPLAVLLFVGVYLNAQEAPKEAKPAAPPAAPADPFLKEKEKKTKEAAPSPDKIINVGTLFQYIDVKRERWQKWLAENETPLDAGALRREVDGWLSTGDAELAETSLIMGKSGLRSKVESNREVFYPVEFTVDPGGLPLPTSFERKNTGTTAEVDPVLNLEGGVEMSFAPERVNYAGENPPRKENGAEEGDIRWPLFASQRVNCMVNLTATQWGLIGCETSLDRAETHQTLIFARPALHRFEDKPAAGPTNGQGMLTFQWIEVGHDQLNGWLMGDGDLSASIGGGLHEKALAAGATLLNERVVRFRTGQRVENESIREVIYPTAYDRGEEADDHASPAALETRNVGTTVEVDPVFNETDTILDLNMAPEKVFHLGESIHHRVLVNGAWQPNLTNPVFYTMKATTQVSLPMNTPMLVAVMSPPNEEGWIDSSRKVLLFVKVSR